MSSLTLDQLLAPRVEKVDLPELGGCVYVRAMTGGKRHELTKSWQGLDDTEAARLLLRNTVCDENGALLFANGHDPMDIDAGPLDTLIEMAMRVNRLDAKAVEQAEKNSEPT